MRIFYIDLVNVKFSLFINKILIKRSTRKGRVFHLLFHAERYMQFLWANRLTVNVYFDTPKNLFDLNQWFIFLKVINIIYFIWKNY